MFIPDPDLDFYPFRIPILDPGVKKAPDPESGSTTLTSTLANAIPDTGRAYTTPYR
jgi:hypothetical protein